MIRSVLYGLPPSTHGRRAVLLRNISRFERGGGISTRKGGNLLLDNLLGQTNASFSGKMAPLSATATRPLSTSTASASTSSWSRQDLENKRTLHHATNFILDPRQNPLASMGQSSWDDTVAIMNGWLHLTEPADPLATANNQSITNNFSSDTGMVAMGYTVDFVERLLQRLVAEQATTNRSFNVLRSQRDLIISQWQLVLVNAWIQVCRQQTEPEMIGAAAERAEAALGRIVEWYNRGGCWVQIVANDDPLPVSEFASLVKEWLRMENAEGCTRAADLLITWTEGEEAVSLLETHQGDISACFNCTMKQCTELLREQQHNENRDFGKTANALAARMDLLRNLGWTEVDQVSNLSRKIALLESFNSADSSAGDSIEESEIFEQMAESIAHADQNDYDTIVHGVIPRFMGSKTIPTDIAEDIGAALTDFFVKRKDAKNATQWMQFWDRIVRTRQESHPWVPLDRYLAVFELWVEEGGQRKEAVWRADEILQRCETLEREFYQSEQPIVLEFDLYLKMLRMWAASEVDFNVRTRKVRGILKKLLKDLNEEQYLGIYDVKSILSAVMQDNSAVLSKEEIDYLIVAVKREWASAPDDVIEVIMGALTKQAELHNQTAADIVVDLGFGSELEGKLGNQVGILKTKKALTHFLPAKNMDAKSRLELIRVLGGFEDATNWDVGCYDAAISGLFPCQFNDEETISTAKKLLECALKSIADGSLPGFSSESIASLLDNAIVKSGYRLEASDTSVEKRQWRATLASDFLRIAEDQLLSVDPKHPIRYRFATSPIPQSCFHRVLVRLEHSGQYGLCEDTYTRMINYHRAGGYAELLPNHNSLKICMGAIYKMDGPECCERLKNLQRELRELYKQANKPFPFEARIDEMILKCYRTQQDIDGALQFVEEELDTMSASQTDSHVASVLLMRAIGLASELGRTKAYPLILRLFRTYVMDKELKVDLDAITWRRILIACLHPRKGDKAIAMKTSIMAMTEMKKNNRSDSPAYVLFTAIIAKHLDGKQLRDIRIEAASAAFQSCISDGLLNQELRDRFQSLVGPARWKEIFTAKLLPDGSEPVEWRKKFKERYMRRLEKYGPRRRKGSTKK